MENVEHELCANLIAVALSKFISLSEGVFLEHNGKKYIVWRDHNAILVEDASLMESFEDGKKVYVNAGEKH